MATEPEAEVQEGDVQVVKEGTSSSTTAAAAATTVSSATAIPPSSQKGKPPPLNIPPSPNPNNNSNNNRTTIHNSSPRPPTTPVRKDSDDFPMIIPPVHHFLPSTYDSDGSDGSFVQKQRRSSVDSATSTGSFKYTAPNSNSHGAGPPISPRGATIGGHTKILPYHERRKLLLQQQQQQLKQQQLQQRRAQAGAAMASTPPYPQPQQQPRTQQVPHTTAPSLNPRFAPLPPNDLMPPPFEAQQQQQQQQSSRNSQQQQQQHMPPPPMMMDQMAAYINMYGVPPPNAYPPPPPQSGAATGGPSSSTSSNPPYPYPPGIPPPGYTSQHPYAPGASGYGGYPPHPLGPPPPQAYGQQPPAPPYGYPPYGIAARPTTTTGYYAKPPKPAAGRAPPPPMPQPSSSAEDSLYSVAPPPPPPLAHGRQGSPASSNPSQNRRRGQHRRHESASSGGGGSGSSFLDLLRQQPWTPPQITRPFVMVEQPPPDNRPPASRGTHQRLPSISQDDWTESEKDISGSSSSGTTRSSTSRRLPDTTFSSYSTTGAVAQDYDEHTNEHTSLLPPSGISTNEQDGANRQLSYGRLGAGDSAYQAAQPQQQQHRRRNSDHRRTLSSSGGVLLEATMMEEDFLRMTQRRDNRGKTIHDEKRRQKKKKKKQQRRAMAAAAAAANLSSDDEEGIAKNNQEDFRKWTKKRARMLEKERNRLMAQWKAEAQQEAAWSSRYQRAPMASDDGPGTLDRKWQALSALWSHHISRIVVTVETFVANLPLTIGAIAMAIVTLGVVWFKFAEENLSSCEPVHFHSSQCTFPEFPGCFYCDTTSDMYQAALSFHYGCKIVAGFLAMLFVLKVLLATRVVLDELSSPTTASPAGLLCMTTVCVFAGRGMIGQVMVTAAAAIHMSLVLWFAYIALAYRIMPEPSWFPNTVGVGLSAVKVWLYYPLPGHLLMAVSLVANFFFFPISMIRVALNEKISATVGWMQMSAPAISLYALTIMAQPSFEEEHPDVTNFQRVHRMVYLPCMHVMAALSVLGFAASCHSLWNRWHDFQKKVFSPAHAAFCFPVLSHANALQAYRGAIISFSQIHPRSWRMVILYVYWFAVLISGTVATLWITAKFLYCLPRWTNLDLTGEEEPPAPNDTIIAMRDMVTTGESMQQPFVSPAVLQANETGALVLARGGPDGGLRYVRTRRLTALGFEPMMNWSEMQEEREVLLDWVGKHPPRRRHRTLSVPGIDFRYGGEGLGSGNSGIYGSITWSGPDSRRRADTESPRAYY